MRNTKLNIYIQCTILSSMIKLYEYVFVRYFCCTFIYMFSHSWEFSFFLWDSGGKKLLFYILFHTKQGIRNVYICIYLLVIHTTSEPAIAGKLIWTLWLLVVVIFLYLKCPYITQSPYMRLVFSPWIRSGWS